MIIYVDAVSLGYISTSSDERYKQHIVALPDTAIERLMQLRPVSYQWQDKGIFRDDGITREGFTAQEVIIASGVTGDETTKNLMSLNLTPSLPSRSRRCRK